MGVPSRPLPVGCGAGHAEQDSFISRAHSERLHAAYAGDKNLVTFDGDHNSHRPAFFYASVLIFLHNVLQIAAPLPPGQAAATAADQSGCGAHLDLNMTILAQQPCDGLRQSWNNAAHIVCPARSQTYEIHQG